MGQDRVKPRVVNVRRGALIGGFVLVDRTTYWGNQYRCGPKNDERRAEAIRMNRDWVAVMLRSPEYREKMREELAGKVLGCHCAPLPCHATTLMAAANAIDLLS